MVPSPSLAYLMKVVELSGPYSGIGQLLIKNERANSYSANDDFGIDTPFLTSKYKGPEVQLY